MSMSSDPSQGQPPAPQPTVTVHRSALVAGVVGLSVGFVLGALAAGMGARPPSPSVTPAMSATLHATAPAAPQGGQGVVGASTAGEADGDDPPAPAFPRQREDLAAAQRIAGMTPEARNRALCAVESQANREIRYALLERNVDRFHAAVYVASGRAIQVQDVSGESGSFILVSMDSYASQVLAVFTYTRPGDDVVADRRVRFYGRVVGSFTYNTRNGQTLTVPRVHALAVVRHDNSPECPRTR